MTILEHMREDGSANTCAGGSSSRRHLYKSKEIFQKGKNLQRWDRKGDDNKGKLEGKQTSGQGCAIQD